MRRYAGDLEEQVQARTVELREDIARRQQAEASLRESEEKHRALVENAGEGIFVVQGDRIVYANEKGAQILHSSLEALAERPSVEFIHPEDRALVLERSRQRQRGIALPSRYAFRMLTAEGGTVWVELNSVRIAWQGAPATLNFVSDITERRLAEAERERLMLAMEQAAEIIVITDDSGTIQYVNCAFERITGYTRGEALGQNPRLLKSGRHDAAFYQQMWAVLKQGETWNGRLVNRRKDGTLYTEEATISPVRDSSGGTVNYVATKRDVTDELKLQDQLVQAQKMESVGRLAGGVAHDFNNMLQAILGNAALALQDLPADSPLRESLEEIEKSAQRSADLTRQLLAFARKQTIAPKVLDLNDTVAGMLKMLRRLIGENIDLAWMPGAELWPVEMDPSQIDQVLANLCVNARDAIGGVGKVTIETSNVTLDDTYAATHPEAVAGDYVQLIVSDTGKGMDEETRSHLFEPFFTTKERGKGTGLGLATVFGIVKQNRGLINVHSEPGQGTSFKIHLLRAEAEALGATAVAPKREVHGTETVLLVEDEGQILHLGRRILEQHGYTVLAASTPAAALEVAAQLGAPIHMLITDVVMPGMNGKELVAQLRVGRPGLRCLYMSGYTANVIAHHGVLDAGVAFLQKPFTIQTLAEKVREVLDTPLEPRGQT